MNLSPYIYFSVFNIVIFNKNGDFPAINKNSIPFLAESLV